MNLFENENSLNKDLNKIRQIDSKNISSLKLKFTHKIFNSINISLLILIFILSFLSFNSQRKWTMLYKNLAKIRLNNNNLIDYISKTEEFYIDEIESLNRFKKTTPKDLIYLDKQIIKKKKNRVMKYLKFIQAGLKESRYQRGY